ncbi:tetratricopeptide repeat protein [bacterium]|nr:tetratricopeptide repeat protein [bacterium]
MPDQNHLADPFTGARATPKLVGRHDEIAKVIETVEGAGHNSRLIHLYGGGGIGKTRLLGSLLNVFTSNQAYLVPSELIDLYHAETNAVEGLIAEIYRVLKDNASFPNYEQSIRDLQELLANRPEANQAIAKARDGAIDNFVEDLRIISQAKKIMIALDTAEKLDLQRNPLAQQLGVIEWRKDTISWLCDIVSQVSQVVVLLAGRPSRTGLHDEFRAQIGEQYIPFLLPGLFEDEAQAYFDAVIAALANSKLEDDQRIAKRLNKISSQMRQVIFYALRDDTSPPTIRPIWLALAIDYLSINTGPVISEFLLSIEEAKLLSADICASVRDKLGSAFTRALAQARPTDVLVRNLGWLRKGATAELLAMISGIEAEDFAKGWEHMRTLSFIKQRPRDQRLFLHDETYEIIERFMLHQVPDAERERIFNKLQEHYERAITEIGTKIDELIDPFAESASQIVNNPEEFGDLNRSRHTLYIEDVYYSLRQNAFKGFQKYFNYAEEAVLYNDEELGVLLRAEMRSFVVESNIPHQADGIDGLNYTDVVVDESVRWIKWMHTRSKNDEALALAHTLATTLHAQIVAPGGILGQAELNSWHGLIEAEIGNYNEAFRFLTEAVDRLVEYGKHNPKTPRWAGILARAYNNLGYTYDIVGRSHRSVQAYREALPLWRALHFEGDHANTLNNLGYAHAQIGEYDAAQICIRDGLRLRERQGLRPSVGYSLSTLAAVNIEAFASEIAIEQARRAIKIFQQTDSRRGEGMGYRTLAEAMRRVSGSPTSRQQALSIPLLEEAEEHALSAVNIFRHEVNEPVRLVWALLELGCVYREWYVWRTKSSQKLSPKETREERDLLTAKAIFDLGNAAFAEAADLAEEHRLPAQGLDALISYARLHYFRDGAQQTTQSQQIRHKVETIFANHYTLNDMFYNHEIGSIPRDAMLIRLGDWHTFLGKEALDNYTSDPSTLLCKAAKHFGLAFRCYGAYSNQIIRKQRTSRSLFYDVVKTFNPAEILEFYNCIDSFEREFGLEQSELRSYLVEQFGDRDKHLVFD